MRDYDDDYADDSIPLYTPVVQRVIILAAVVIAVPVLMWTITTFVRSYVARPKVPLVEHVASTNAPTRVPLLAAPPSPAPAPMEQSAPPRGEAAAASETSNPSGEIKRGTLNIAALSNASPTAATLASAASVQAASMPVSSPPVSASAAAGATGDAATGSNQTAAATASLPRSPLRPTESATSSGPSSSDRGVAWPNPNAASAPDFAAPRLAPSAPPQPARMAAVEVLPADEPLRGRVPLPRQRPNTFAMAGTMAGTMAAAKAGTMPATMAAASPVPLPRVRPGGAPADTGTVVDIPVGGRYELENAH
jgi:hypothetical protein